LTFDDGPHPVWTPRVLAALQSCDASATFFVHAAQAERHVRLVEKILHGGHEIGLHCWRHLRHGRHSAAVIEADTNRALEALGGVGVHPCWWRVPWGQLGPSTPRIARTRGLRVIGWDLDTHDWRGDRAVTMLEHVTPGLRPGAIVLMHDGLGPGARRTLCGETVRLLAPLVRALRERGCEPTTVSAALRCCPT